MLVVASNCQISLNLCLKCRGIPTTYRGILCLQLRPLALAFLVHQVLLDDLSRHVLESLCERKGGEQGKEGETTVWEGQEGGREGGRNGKVRGARVRMKGKEELREREERRGGKEGGVKG